MTPEYAVYKFHAMAVACAKNQESLQRRLAIALQTLAPVQNSCFPKQILLDRWIRVKEEILKGADMDRERPEIACSDADAGRLIEELIDLGSELWKWTAVDAFILHHRR